MARSLNCRLAKIAGPKKKSQLTHVFLSPLAVMCARGLTHPPPTRMQLFPLKRLYMFAELLFQCLFVVHIVSCFCCLWYTILTATLSAQGLAH